MAKTNSQIFHSALTLWPVANHNDTMAVQAMSNRQMYPPMASYHTPQSNSPASQSPQHDHQGRAMYGQGFPLPPQFYGYPQYTLPQQPNYTHYVPAPQSYPAVTNTSSGMLVTSQAPPTMMHQQSSHSHPPTPVLSQPQRMKVEQSPVDRPSNLPLSHNNVPLISQGSNISNAPPAGSAANPNAAPGPIPATTPLVVRQDQNGVQWIAFEYSRDRVKMEYTIRCDVESVNVDELSDEFKSANCVYPRACGNKDSYKGNRLNYESECNAVGWALADLNSVLREKRGLIQRAVDSWRNSNQDPRLRSRRVRRMAKINNRKTQLTSPPNVNHISGPSPVVAASQMSNAMMNAISNGASRPPHMDANAGQLHHHHAHLDGRGAIAGDDVNGMFH